MVLGVTGPFASGKSSAASYFRRRGFRVIDVDSIGHSVLKLPAVRSALRKVLGPGILLPGGRVDRRTLGNLVFGDHRKLAILNKIVHPLMRKEVRSRMGSRRANCVIDAALLFEMGLDRLCDETILVTAPVKAIMDRGRERNGFDAARIRSILAGQQPVAVKRKKADFTVANGGSLRSLDGKMARIFEILASRRPG